MLISAAFCEAQVSCSPPTSATIVPDTWYAGTINYVTVTTPNFDIYNIGAYCASVDLTTTSGAEVPVTLWENLDGGPGWASWGVEPAASVPTEAALLVVEYWCDPGDADTPCPPGTGADGIVWKVTFPVQIIGCPAPTIASVTPDGWWAGQQQDITITGNCFMTASDTSGPSKVTVTDGAGAVTLSNVNVVSSTQITATVKVTKKAPAETVTLTVTNPSSSSGGPQSATANPAPVVLPVPVIKWKDKEISGDKAKNQSVKVGQPVELTTTPATLPGGFTISKSTWTVDRTNIGGYDGSDDGISLTDTPLNDTKTTFYWLYPDDPFNVTYEYCATDPSGNQLCTSPQAKATFKATGGGSSVSMSTYDSDKASIENLYICDDKGKATNKTEPWLGYGDLRYAPGVCSGNEFIGRPGIRLSASGAPGGKYVFVQLINSDSRNYTNSNGGTISCGPTSGLDGHNPYRGMESLSVASDGPTMSLLQNYVFASRSFNATMYLLWQPDNLPSATAPSIPVPIGYQEWQFGATADGVQGRKEWKWKDPRFSPSNAHGRIGSFTYSTSSDPNTWDGYPQWDDTASTECNN